MSTVLIAIGIIVVVMIAAILIIAASKPATFRIQRATAIEAPPERIFPLINDFQQWRSWSPWEKLDPNLERTYGGPPSGPGATYAWHGNSNVGQGRMEILEATPNAKIVVELDFIKPFAAQNTVDFTLEPRTDATYVTWTMVGPNLFMGKVMSIFMDMDKMVGGQFEQGLLNLKTIAEKPAIH
jgi:uncharacterized protein YndB with AHSA1/START domain